MSLTDTICPQEPQPNRYRRVKAHPTARLSPTASIMGDVTLGRDVCVLDFACLRGDDEAIFIGDETNIQEGAIVHVFEGFPVTVGQHVTVGHRALLHGCTIGDNTLVGMGATVMNGARIGSGCVIAAGALVSEGKEFPDNCLIMGVPARLKRMLSPEEVQRMCTDAGDEYLRVSAAMLEEGLLCHPAPDMNVHVPEVGATQE
ncbi:MULTISPECIES: gamma carbonic anhydrase family protein [Gordonibacter]|uniref:Gamma carbonic anhydrase family protein n=1 Tax=Gordonibacter faecis TaxID=3047475 RepID=A0ABT7DPB7_9ACTN|nr:MULTISPECIES: gamma carbonic anhydrase family protein [unclassified Gordonibacter]MDJ1650371.1 gamma carbonic anhydrase family protein [Gordonibacter sp. KGMB12511]HIW76784.1 gamma carbonic anhydrase family protein [Candidatus Gordonibacter avicola]